MSAQQEGGYQKAAAAMPEEPLPVGFGLGLGLQQPAGTEKDEKKLAQVAKEEEGLFDFDDLPEFDEADRPEFAASEKSTAADDSAPHKTDMFDFDDLPDFEPAKEQNFPGEGVVPYHFARIVAGKFKQDSPCRATLAILANGSRGDVEPFVALVQALTTRGFKVTVLTNTDFVDYFKSAGVDVITVYPSYKSVFDKMGGVAPAAIKERWSVQAADVNKSMQKVVTDDDAHKAFKSSAVDKAGAVKDPLEALAHLSPSAVLYTVMAEVPARQFEGSHGVPALPVHFTSVIEFDSGRQPPRPLLFATSSAVDLNLPVSNWVHVTGPWQMQEGQAQELFEDGQPLGPLRRFIDQGEQPVAIGWGSMLAKGHPPVQMLGTALRALKTLGKRGVILGGWAKLHEIGEELLAGGAEEIGSDRQELADFASENVFFAAHVPHSWLYPRCSCVVHHGGAGTTYAAFRAQRPSVITPFFGDQFQFAQRVEQLGAGYTFLRAMPDIAHFELGNAILEAEANGFPEELARTLKKERGAELAADVIENFVDDWVISGRFIQEKKRVQKALSDRVKRVTG